MNDEDDYCTQKYQDGMVVGNEDDEDDERGIVKEDSKLIQCYDESFNSLMDDRAKKTAYFASWNQSIRDH